MRVKTKRANIEKRMQVGDLERNCPVCRTRPVETVYLVDEGQEVPPSRAPPCPLCGKGPTRIVIDKTEGGACLPEGHLSVQETTR